MMKIWELDQYQNETQRTAGDDNLAILGLGLTGEAGEVADLLKKHLGHGHPLDKAKAAKELGDVLWYVARLADSLGVSLSDVATANVEKLRARYPDGFTSAASVARVDVNEADAILERLAAKVTEIIEQHTSRLVE